MKNNKIFWNWKKDSNELYIDGVIAEESWFDDEITPRLFFEELKNKIGVPWLRFCRNLRY